VLAHALGQVNASDRAWIGNFLGRPRERRLTREVLQLRQILAKSGSIEWAQQSAVAFAEAAKREFVETAFASVPANPDLEWLRRCVDFIVQRDA
jgi:geranylgeranyl pyrophosphate synthase